MYITIVNVDSFFFFLFLFNIIRKIKSTIILTVDEENAIRNGNEVNEVYNQFWFGICSNYDTKFLLKVAHLER